MNKRNFLLLPISLMFIACGGAEQMSALECAKDTGPEPPCAGDPKNPEVTINTNTWVFTPRCIKANKKEKIVFRLTPAADNPLGSTAIQPKDLKDTWLTGVNSPDEMKIEVMVPDWVALDKYRYGVFKSNGDCFDPRVHVVDE